VTSGALRPLTLSELADGQVPAQPVPQARQRIREMNARAGRRIVVLDDDPTGSQVVHDVPVLTSWDDEDLRWAFAQPSDTFFVLTNSRSLGEAATRDLLEDLDLRLHRVADQIGTSVVILSRSDSTLRGHYPLETDVLQAAASRRGSPYDAVLIAPAYIEAGRVTVDDVHYARIDDRFLPVGQTDYATDDAFGYASSRLPEWVEEKSDRDASKVFSLSLRDIRKGGVERVTELLLSARHGAVVVVNALEESDLEVVALALLTAEATGWRAVCRVGPSFVPVRAGIERRAPLTAHEIAGTRTGRGLVVVGSHVELTTRQVQALLELPDLTTVELDVAALLADGAAELKRCSTQLLAAEGDTVLITSRTRVVGAAGQDSLQGARTISAALVELTRRFVRATDVAWVVAKGGITSHDVATEGLQIRRATVLGQLFPGIVSVWRAEPGPGDDGRLTGLPYVVFAGNVGDDITLREAVRSMRGAPDGDGGAVG
jgi:uncharacterized protein YgbK (DUF1537 family)